MKNIILSSLAMLAMVGCTGQREMYSKNGLTIVQVGADPTPINGGYNILITERDGISTIVAVDSTPTVASQLAGPAAAVGAAVVLRPDEVNVTHAGGAARDPRVDKLVHQHKISNR